MRDRLPPLNALRAFEALSLEKQLTKAAERLCVTHSAVSHQIKLLERNVGVPLVRRTGRRIALTDAGEHFAKIIHKSFEAIRHETDQLPLRSRKPVTVGTLPIVATQWLIPRLPEFFSAHPEIAIHVAYHSHAGPVTGNTDITISFDRDATGGRHTEPLIPAAAAPVCSPSYLQKFGPFDNDADLLHARLLHDEDMRMWKTWFRGGGLDFSLCDDTAGLFLEGSSLMLAAALSGQGVALGRLALIEDELSRGRLVQLSPRAMDEETFYHLSWEEDARSEPTIGLVQRWLSENLIDLDNNAGRRRATG
ncbi:MAG: LysR family transcriptional regulator [Alphaproteobacteria bacterium]